MGGSQGSRVGKGQAGQLGLHICQGGGTVADRGRKLCDRISCTKGGGSVI